MGIKQERCMLFKNQNVTELQLYGYLLPKSQDIQITRTKCAENCLKSKDELIPAKIYII